MRYTENDIWVPMTRTRGRDGLVRIEMAVTHHLPQKRTLSRQTVIDTTPTLLLTLRDEVEFIQTDVVHELAHLGVSEQEIARIARLVDLVQAMIEAGVIDDLGEVAHLIDTDYAYGSEVDDAMVVYEKAPGEGSPLGGTRFDTGYPVLNPCMASASIEELENSLYYSLGDQGAQDMMARVQLYCDTYAL